MRKIGFPEFHGGANPGMPAQQPDFRRLLQQMLQGHGGLLGGNFAPGQFAQQAQQMSQYGPLGNFVGPIIPPNLGYAPDASPTFGGGGRGVMGGPYGARMRSLLV